MLSSAFVVLVWGIVAEIGDRTAYEPAIEPGALIGIAVIISSILGLGGYLLWPKSK